MSRGTRNTTSNGHPTPPRIRVSLLYTRAMTWLLIGPRAVKF